MRGILVAYLLFAAALGSASPAHAVDMQPGTSCAGYSQGVYRPTGGPENPDGALVVCDGSIWQPILRYSSAGNAVMFASTGLAAAPLHVWGEAIIGEQGLACSPATEGALRYNSTGQVIDYCDGSAWGGIGGGGSGLWTAGSGDDIYYNSGTPMVGIGLTDPVSPLHIYKTGSGALLRLERDAADVLKIGNAASTWALESEGHHIALRPDAVSPGLVVRTSGYVGIGTDEPEARLHLHTEDVSEWINLRLTNTATSSEDGGTYLGLDADSDHAYLWNYEGQLYFGTNDVERMRIDSDGNVGVGTDSPAAPLDVAGEIKFSSSGLSCGPDEEGAVRYTGGDPPWEYCDGSAWVNFKQPRCQDDDTGECYLEATRSNDDPDFVAANIKDGVNVLGVTGTMAAAAPDCTDDSSVTCTLEATRSNDDPEFKPENIACGVTILGVTGTLGTTEGDPVTVFLTSGTSWDVPSDWNDSDNTIEVIGGGGGGDDDGGNEGGGGGGGAYSKVSGVSLTPGGSVGYSVGSGGSNNGGNGGDTWLCDSTSNCTSIGDSAVIVGAKGGGGASNTSGGSGGSAASGVGVTRYNGGNGGITDDWGGGGGGGAAGPNGDGGDGGSVDWEAGGGGGGGGGGTNGAGGGGETGHDGGNNYLGDGGGSGGSNTGDGSSGIDGGGGGGGGGDDDTHGGNGGAGTEWEDTHGSGGGGGGAGSDGDGDEGTAGGDGGLYGGGGGGASDGNGNAGAGAQGIIVITYTPESSC